MTAGSDGTGSLPPDAPDEGGPGDGPDYDVIVVGAGISGLSAAHRLAGPGGRRVLVLEALDRAGGRVLSRPVAGGWLNFGAHVLPGPDTAFGAFAASLGIEVTPIPGSVMGVAYRDRLVTGGPRALYPVRLGLPLGATWGLARWGAQTWVDLRRARRQPAGTPVNPILARGAIVGADATYRRRIDRLPADAYRIVEAAVRRSGAEPDQLTRGAARDQFALTFDGSRSHLVNGIVGGAGRLVEALVDALRTQRGVRVRLGERVTRIRRRADGRLDVAGASGARWTAGQVIVATRADQVGAIDVDLPAPVRHGLAEIPYGPYTVASWVTRPVDPLAPGLYAIVMADPDGPTMTFHHSDLLRHPAGSSHVHSFMSYASAGRARELSGLDDEAVVRRFVDATDRYLPGTGAAVAHAEVVRWSAGLPIVDVGTARFLRGLAQGQGDIILAGDYFSGSGGLEAAFAAGQAGAALAASRLAGGTGRK